MIFQVKHPVALAAVFLWLGFVCAISFMEAWLKFRAPGITVPLGLGIGRIVFAALNKVEWVLALAIAANILWTKPLVFGRASWLFLLPVAILFAQTVWLLPVLDARAELHITGQPVPPSNLHFLFVGFELVKVLALAALGISFFKKTGT
ncbi:MAG: hypothetical protein IPL27_17560 [Lewinellaceae bacterium]|nr:hypothetical protein [Lewinellaceae bacterium]